MLLRFAASFLIFTFGPGAACGLWLTRSLDTPRRIVVLLGLGTAAAAVFIDILGRLGWLAAFPYVAVAATVAALVMWNPRLQGDDRTAWTPTDLRACAVIVALALGTGYIVFAHRVVEEPAQVAVYGDYDSLDLIYYAAISAEASHTVPPTAAYYAGRELNYAYYPELVLAMVHRFGGVPLLDVYFKYAWPAFLALGGVSVFLCVRALAPTGAALLSVVLMMLAGDFSYLAAWYLPHADINWDYVLWPTNFLSPTMETLHFNSITPSLPIFFVAIWCVATGFRRREYAWMAMAAALMGVLFQFKPFTFIVMMAAFVAAILFSRDWDARRRFALTLVLSGTFALPFAYRSLRLYADRRSELRIDYFLLPLRMLIKLDLTGAFTEWAARVAPAPWLARPILLAAATAVFFAGGMGIRWLGVPPLWSALRGRMAGDRETWRLLAWAVLAGVFIPFVLVTEPYNDTLQFYQTGLYLLWIFVAVTLAALIGKNRVIGALVLAAGMAVSLPSSLHYLERRWTDGQRPPLAALTRMELQIAEFLRQQDPQATVILNDRPMDPSLMAVLSERRIVLAWARYAVGSGERLGEVNAFYGGSRTLENTLNILRKHRVTHVIVHPARDRVPPDALAKLNLLMGDGEVALYEVPDGL